MGALQTPCSATGGKPQTWGSRLLVTQKDAHPLSAHSRRTQARPGGSRSHRRRCDHLAWPLSPSPLQYLCKWGRALRKHCHSLGDHWALHTPLVQVGGEQGQLCVLSCLSVRWPDLFDGLNYFFKLSRLLLCCVCV